MRRRGLLATLTAALAGAAVAAASAETVKVGVILTYSGPQASLGGQIDKGIALYVKEHASDLPPGVTLELVRRDDTFRADVAKRLAQELITRDHVRILAGVVGTPAANAIAPLTAEAKIPFVVMNAAGVTTTRLSPYVARVSFTHWQLSLPLGRWAADHLGKRGMTLVSDFQPGYDGEAGFAKGFKDAGGEIVGALRMPVINLDFAPFLQRVKDAKPDVLYVFVPAGQEATALMKAYADLGLKAAGIKLVGPQDIVTDEELPNMGDAPLGIVTAANYSAAATRPANQQFIAAWRRDYGDALAPNFFSVQGWDGMDAIFAVIKATKGEVTGDAAMKVLTGWKSDASPRGPIMIDPETRDIIENVY
ncbi:MAG TPA: ABC transporter substrate-binding protein, partial [Stellaceae bacterium]|nr:ABC transporter substrate-binding protein [Stellaceae bacterium]